MFHAIGLLIASLSLSLPQVGQKHAVKSAPDERSAPMKIARSGPPVRQRAIDELHRLADVARQFEDERLAIRVQSRIASALWKQDPRFARSLFEEVLEKIDLQDGQTPPSTGGFREPDGRVEILSLLSKIDPELARRFISPGEGSRSRPTATVPDGDRTRLELSNKYARMAVQAVSSNPHLAFDLARTSLAYGLARNLMPVMLSLRRVDASQTDNLFALALLIAEQQAPDQIASLAILVPYVLSAPTSSNARHSDSEMSPVLVGRFLEFAFYTLIYADPRAQGIRESEIEAYVGYYYRTIQQLIPLFETHHHERANQLRVRLDQLLSTMRPEIRSSVAATNAPTTVSSVLRKVEATSDRQAKDRLFYQAAMMASANGDVEEALSTIEKISDSAMKSGIASEIRKQASISAIAQKQFDSAYASIREIPDVLGRASAFAKLIGALRSSESESRALEMIAEAERSVRGAAANAERARAMFLIAQSAARVNASRGFEVMESAIRCINEIDTASGKMPEGPRQIGRTRSETGGSSESIGGFDFEDGFSALARADFDRAMTMATSIKEAHLSVVAQVIVCIGGLSKSSGEEPAPAAVSTRE